MGAKRHDERRQQVDIALALIVPPPSPSNTNMEVVALIIITWPLIAIIGWLLTSGICDRSVRLLVRILLALPCLGWIWIIFGALVFGGGF